MKKVLAIAPYPYLPYFSGGQKFIALFLHYLGKETDLSVITVPGNDFSLATTYRTLPILKSSFSRYFDPGLVKKITAEVKKGGYDTLIWEHPYYAWLAFRIREKTGVRTIIHTHNIEYRRFRSTGRWWWPLLRWYEKWAFKKADHLFFITPEDRAFAINHWNIDPAKCHDLPFGIELFSFPPDRAACREITLKRHGIPPGHRILFFNGLLNYKPNLEALKVILEKINPVLLAENKFPYTILICGKGLPEDMENLDKYRDQHIIYAGFVEDIETYFKAADIFLNPVQSGGGIKTKMVEAIAYGATVIATETGATGIIRDVCGEKLVLVRDDDWERFTSAIGSQAGQSAVTPAAYYEYYAWEKLVKRIKKSLPDDLPGQPEIN